MRVWCHASFRLQEQPVLTRSDVSAPLYSRRCHFTSRLLPLQYRLVLCSLFLNAPVDNCFHFSIPFHAISATSQKCFGGHGRSPLHSISDQVPFTGARSKQHNATYSNCRGSKCFCCCEAVFSCGLCRMPWPCVCPIQVHSNRVTNNYI